MTWREVFARAWLVLRSRVRRHRTCGECGSLLTGVENGEFLIWPLMDWSCEDCDRAEAARRFAARMPALSAERRAVEIAAASPGAVIAMGRASTVVTLDGRVFVSE
jgi:hypothetical protein